MASFRNQVFRVGRTSLTDDDINTIAETVVARMLDAPSGKTIVIRHWKGTFTAQLGGVPRPGDLLWLPLRRNSKPKRWRVTEVEWFVEYPLRDVEVHVREEPLPDASAVSTK